jgi:hypothetical protein
MFWKKWFGVKQCVRRAGPPDRIETATLAAGKLGARLLDGK